MPFKDHFSSIAAAYAAYRPTQPPALLDFVAACAPRREVAWDCATGNGQAAVGLAERFARVIATDASAEQIAHATPHPRVEYRVAPAEASGLEAASADVVTVAQAMHWLDAEAFYREVRRVVVPGGAIVVWSYQLVRLDAPVIDRAVRRFAYETLGSYWPPERRHVDTGDRTLPFPFPEIPAPELVLVERWTLAQLAGYLRTWSATARYVAAHGRDPVAPLEAELREDWGGEETRRTVTWPYAVRAGRVV